MDLSSELIRNRILFVRSGIDEAAAQTIISALLALSATDPHIPIQLYINSTGGSVLDGLAIYDTMRLVTCPVATYCLGCAASMAVVLLAAGTPGLRHATQNSLVLIHEVYASLSDTDRSLVGLRRAHELAGFLNDTICRILAFHTGQPLRRVRMDMRRNRVFTAEEAVRYGLVDRILDVPTPATAIGRGNDR